MSMWDDEAGYDYDDPKHPSYAERAFDRADMERKRRREDDSQLGPPTMGDHEDEARRKAAYGDED